MLWILALAGLAVNRPLIDSTLIRADAILGLNARSVVEAAARLPLLHAPLTFAYTFSVALLLRPERLRLSMQPPSVNGEQGLAGSVEKALYSGSDRRYLVRLGERLLWNVRVPNDESGQKGLQRGDAVHVRWHMADAVVLSE